MTRWPSPWIPAKREQTYLFTDPVGEDRVIMGSVESLEGSLFVGGFVCCESTDLVEVMQ